MGPASLLSGIVLHQKNVPRKEKIDRLVACDRAQGAPLSGSIVTPPSAVEGLELGGESPFCPLGPAGTYLGESFRLALPSSSPFLLLLPPSPVSSSCPLSSLSLPLCLFPLPLPPISPSLGVINHNLKLSVEWVSSPPAPPLSSPPHSSPLLSSSLTLSPPAPQRHHYGRPHNELIVKPARLKAQEHGGGLASMNNQPPSQGRPGSNLSWGGRPGGLLWGFV